MKRTSPFLKGVNERSERLSETMNVRHGRCRQSRGKPGIEKRAEETWKAGENTTQGVSLGCFIIG